MDQRKHIVVNTRLLLKGKMEGIGWFAYEVLKRITQAHPEVDFTFCFDRKYHPDFIFGENVHPVVIAPQARHPILWYLWFHVRLNRFLTQKKADLFFSPEFYLTPNTQVPQINTIHDLAYEHSPQDLPRFASAFVRKYSPMYADWASKIITVSEFSKKDIIHWYKTPSEKIVVSYNGCNSNYHPLSEDKKQQIRDTYSQGAPYFHFVGTIHPRKNIETLLKAFDQFKTQSGSDVKLLLVGRKGWNYAGAMEVFQSMTHKEDVTFTGYMMPEAMNGIYAASIALCYIPHLEGFGIPPLEAMHAETAVIASNVSSLPEVCGTAAKMVSPTDTIAVSNAMSLLYHSAEYRTQLIRNGRIQREKFSWDTSAETIWKVMERYL